MMKKLIYDKINIKPCYGLLDVPENFSFNNFNEHCIAPAEPVQLNL